MMAHPNLVLHSIRFSAPSHKPKRPKSEVWRKIAFTPYTETLNRFDLIAKHNYKPRHEIPTNPTLLKPNSNFRVPSQTSPVRT